MQPTPQYSWPCLNARVAAEVWIKHENHGLVGAFKIRGALVYFRHLRKHGGAPGWGICGMCAAREALGRKTEIVGVVSAHAAAYYESFAQRRPVSQPAQTRIADGMAVPVPDPDALELIWRHVAQVVMVTDSEVE